MQFQDFLGQVQHRAQLDSQEAALRATRATLETFAERLGGEEPRHLAAQLPQELGAYLDSAGRATERFSSDEFFDRVSRREGVDKPQAVYHARVVTEVLCEAVSPGEIEQVRSQLPGDYQRLFAGSAGDMPNA